MVGTLKNCCTLNCTCTEYLLAVHIVCTLKKAINYKTTTKPGSGLNLSF